MIDKYCKDCRYRDILTHRIYFCAYIIYEGKMRGCPCGKGCTKRKFIDDEWLAFKREKDLTEYICG